jgi:hypothetical protein
MPYVDTTSRYRPGTVQTPLRLDQGLYADARERATRDGHSFASFVRALLEGVLAGTIPGPPVIPSNRSKAGMRAP